MDPRFLRTFATVTRLASFSAAARELGYTQSAVSQHIAALEGELGAPLLSRRPVAPTEAGARLLEHAGARWIDAPDVTVPLDELATLARAEGFRGALRYDGLDVGGLLALVAAGQGLALLPSAAADGVPLAAPALVHRTELLHGGDPL